MRTGVLFVLSFILLKPAAFTEVLPLQVYEFDRNTLSDNQWDEVPGGFIQGPPGSMTFQPIASQTISSSQDQKGLSITVNAGEVVLTYSRIPIETSDPLLIRLIVRSQSPRASIALVAFTGDLASGNVDGSLGLHFPSTAQAFTDAERALVMVYQPAGETRVTPAIQVQGLEGAEGVSIIIDRLEIYSLSDASEYQGSLYSSRHVSPYAADSPLPTSTPSPVFIIPTPTAVFATPTPDMMPTPTPAPTSPQGSPQMIDEQEPNNTLQQSQRLGTGSMNTQIQVSGNLSSGGIQNGDYRGDFDIFHFTVPEAMDVQATVDWQENADLDIYVFMEGRFLGEESGTQRPASLGGTLGVGEYDLILVSKDNPANYTLTLDFRPPTQEIYPNLPSILQGKYVYVMHIPEASGSVIYTYRFDGQGGYDLWSAVSPYDDELRIEQGTYSIQYPFLILNDGKEVKFHELIFESERVVYINGNKYQK